MRQVCLAAIIVSSAATAAAQQVNGTDHPLVGRYEGSKLSGYEQRRFEARQFVFKGTPDRSLVDADKQTIEGKSTVLAYSGPGDRSSLEVFRNYQAALVAKGFTQAYVCENVQGRPKGCPDQRQIKYAVFPLPATVLENGNCWDNARYGLFRRGAQATVALYVEECKNKVFNPKVLISVSEAAAMETGKVTVPSAQDMARAFGSEGRIALYGIYFDTGKAEIKPASKPTLDQIAALLSAEPRLALVITGYTDNVGGFDANVMLSKRRADAVVAALVRDYRIQPARLTGFGAGMTGPRAPNTDEAGRAKNRRVELTPR